MNWTTRARAEDHEASVVVADDYFTVSELERTLAHERAWREACEDRERTLREALFAIERIPRCVTCAGRHVPEHGETCSPECAGGLREAVPDPVRDVPTRVVPLWARETMTFDGPPRRAPESANPPNDSARCEFIAP